MQHLHYSGNLGVYFQVPLPRDRIYTRYLPVTKLPNKGSAKFRNVNAKFCKHLFLTYLHLPSFSKCLLLELSVNSLLFLPGALSLVRPASLLRLFVLFHQLVLPRGRLARPRGDSARVLVSTRHLCTPLTGGN